MHIDFFADPAEQLWIMFCRRRPRGDKQKQNATTAVGLFVEDTCSPQCSQVHVILQIIVGNM